MSVISLFSSSGGYINGTQLEKFGLLIENIKISEWEIK